MNSSVKTRSAQKSIAELKALTAEEQVAYFDRKYVEAGKRYAGNPDLLLKEHPERRFFDYSGDAVAEPESQKTPMAKVISMPRATERLKRTASSAKRSRSPAKRKAR